MENTPNSSGGKSGIGLIILIVCILSCCISSSVWGVAAAQLNKAGRCGSRSVVMCPLNENIGDSKYNNDLLTWLQQGTLSGRHVLNSYYYDDGTGTGIQFCKEDYSTCKWKDSKTKLALTDFLLYRTVFTNNAGKTDAFYTIPANFLMDMGTKSGSIRSLDEFINTVNKYDREFKLKTECSKAVNPKDRQAFFNDCIFFNYPFDSIVSVLQKVVYKDLNPAIISSYAQQIEAKVKASQPLTTFEYYSYFAIQAKSANKVYKFLTE